MRKKLSNLYRLVLSDRNTRNLFFFLILNLFFAFVELFYGLLTNSLGLISDSFHMFFDCSALLLGLAASIVTKWKPSDKFTYGFGRAEILAGLANGLFLLFIALFISKEAIERTFEPPDVHHERLFVISVMGFIVNLIGIFVFQHGGQGHHHGCSHSHSTSSKSQVHSTHPTHNHIHPNSSFEKKNDGVVALDMNGYEPSTIDWSSSYANNHNSHYHEIPSINHSHHHDDNVPLTSSGRHKSGRGQIMQSVLLHIIADTLGSIGVMISAVLMNRYGWMIADPICSLFIAVLISLSVYPLLRDSIFILMQRVPIDIDKKLPTCLQEVQNLDGVIQVYDTHFWSLNSDNYVGCVKLDVTPEANHRFIMSSTKNLLTQLGFERLHIEINQV